MPELRSGKKDPQETEEPGSRRGLGTLLAINPDPPLGATVLEGRRSSVGTATPPDGGEKKQKGLALLKLPGQAMSLNVGRDKLFEVLDPEVIDREALAVVASIEAELNDWAVDHYAELMRGRRGVRSSRLALGALTCQPLHITRSSAARSGLVARLWRRGTPELEERWS
ncbi:hypothetical protein ACGFZK_07545 [Streptomyces sp. NPDC048257]|uniref:hypothetical protein n=1 Tax=Streptomyces sp. NPDC048257 TaxID=3365526 RepID=UPI0037142014